MGLVAELHLRPRMRVVLTGEGDRERNGEEASKDHEGFRENLVLRGISRK